MEKIAKESLKCPRFFLNYRLLNRHTDNIINRNQN